MSAKADAIADAILQLAPEVVAVLMVTRTHNGWAIDSTGCEELSKAEFHVLLERYIAASRAQDGV